MKRRTKTDKSIHDYAVRLRKLTDEQLTEKFYTAYRLGYEDALKQEAKRA